MVVHFRILDKTLVTPLDMSAASIADAIKTAVDNSTLSLTYGGHSVAAVPNSFSSSSSIMSVIRHIVAYFLIRFVPSPSQFLPMVIAGAGLAALLIAVAVMLKLTTRVRSQ